MEFEDLLKKYGVKTEEESRSEQYRQAYVDKGTVKSESSVNNTPNRVTYNSTNRTGNNGQRDFSKTSNTDGGWSESGSFGSNDNIYRDDFSTRKKQSFKSRNTRFNTGSLSELPWLDIICISLIIIEFIVLIINVDAIFYMILPFISNLFVILVAGGVLFLVLYFIFGRRRRRF